MRDGFVRRTGAEVYGGCQPGFLEQSPGPLDFFATGDIAVMSVKRVGMCVGGVCFFIGFFSVLCELWVGVAFISI